jgi:serine/threonine-protein kinase
MRMSVMAGTAMAQTGALAMATQPISDEDLPAGSQAGEYVIEKKIGEGGMGAVYGARHPVIGKRAAIKVIKRELSASAEGVDRFVREAQAVNQIGHPNIVDVFGFGTLPDGRSFFVMEWLEGESLRDRMQRPLAFGQALEVLDSIATALQAAHEAGVVHRDLKPDNVYLARVKGSPAPRVKLLDFGLAKLSGSSEGAMNHTRTGVVMGTPLYLSPEQAKGAKVDTATDVYSLGAMAYEMGAGAVPFMAESAVEIMAMHISARAEPLAQRAPWVPPAFEQLVFRMLEKDPRNRPAIAEVVQQLQYMRTQPEIAGVAAPGTTPNAQWTPIHTPRPQTSPHGVQSAQSSMAPAPAKKKTGLVIGIIAGVVLAAGGAAAFVLMGGKKDTKTDTVAQAGSAQVAATGSAIATDPTKTEPAKTAPVTTEPAAGSSMVGSASEPATGSAQVATAGSASATAPAKTEPVKTEPPKPTEKAIAKTEPPKPTRPEPQKAKLGTVAVTIGGAPRGAVFVDGKLVAREISDISLELAPGDHRIRVEAPNHKPEMQIVHVEIGQKQDLKVTLKKKSINAVHDPFAD